MYERKTKIFTKKTKHEYQLYCILCVIKYQWTHYIYSLESALPADMIHSSQVGLKLGQRRRQWSSIEAAFTECIVFAGLVSEVAKILL